MPTSDNFGFASDSEKSNFMAAYSIAQETGTDIRTAAASQAFKTRAQQLPPEPGTTEPVIGAETLRGLSEAPPSVSSAYRGQEGEDLSSIYAPVASARSDILRGMVDVYSQSQNLKDADERLITKKLVADLDPYIDIDTRVKELTKQGLVSKVMLSADLRNLPPSKRRGIVARRMQMFGNAIDNQLEIRRRRQQKIEGIVAEEVSSIRGREKALSTRLAMLQTMSNQLDKVGADRESQAMMEMSVEKARTDLERTRRQMNKKGIAPASEEEFGALAKRLRSSALSFKLGTQHLSDSDVGRFHVFLQQNPEMAPKETDEPMTAYRYKDPFEGIREVDDLSERFMPEEDEFTPQDRPDTAKYSVEEIRAMRKGQLVNPADDD